jgi:hypothetical protein
MEQVQLSHRANISPHFRLPVLIKYSGYTTWDNKYKISRWWRASGVSGLVVGFALGLG